MGRSRAACLAGSGSMLAEAIHSHADTGKPLLLDLGLKQSPRPPDSEHPLGYGKHGYFWSFIVAALRFPLGGLFSIYEGWNRFHHPEDLSQVWIAIVLLLEISSLLGCLRETRPIRGERSFYEWLRHTRNSELVVVRREDIGAHLGLTLALFVPGGRRRDR